MTVFYQVESSVASSGKRVAVTKRRVRWRWGILNEDALAAGATGAECRGSEHEVTLVWSLTSGKRLILFNGKEVYFSTGRRTDGKFQYSWTASALGNNVLTIIAYAAAPLRSIHGFKQFDLLINGQSCSDMCHIYELGVRKDHATNHELAVAANIKYDVITHPANREEEWQWAEKVIELEQKREMNQAESPPPTRSHSLPIRAQRDFDRVVPPRSNSVPFAHDLLSESSTIVNTEDLLSATLPMEVNCHQAPSNDEFNPNQPPSYETIWSTIMDAYDSSSTNQVDASSRYGTGETKARRNNETSESQVNPALLNPTMHQLQVENIRNDSKNIQIQTDGNQSCSRFIHVQTKNNDDNSRNLEVDTKDLNNKTAVISPRDVSALDKAMGNLVNLEDILSPVFNTKLTMKSDHEKGNRENRSRLPPKMGSQRHFDRQLTLLEIKHQQSNQRIDPSKKVMKAQTHYTAVQNTGAVVVYHYQPQQYNNYPHSYPNTQ